MHHITGNACVGEMKVGRHEEEEVHKKDHRSRGAMDAPSSCAEQAELARGVIGDLAAKWKIIS